MTRILNLTLMILSLIILVSCNSSGDGGGGTSAVSEEDYANVLLGRWESESVGGQACHGCLILVFNEDGTGSFTDVNGDYFGTGSYLTLYGTWQLTGGILTVSTSSGGFSYSETDRISFSGNDRFQFGENVYTR